MMRSHGLGIALLFLVLLFAGCQNGVEEDQGKQAGPAGGPESPDLQKSKGSLEMEKKVVRTDAEWREILTPEQYEIARKKGTERAFTGKYNDHHEKGVYKCVCCGQELFASGAKFDSGSGWPSFYQPRDKESVALKADGSLGMERTEVICSRCDAHLGHVFDDGPAPTGLRYCINSASLRFEDAKNAPPALETATFGGGCFWCTEAVFETLEGVKSVRVGFMGGEVKNPTYEQVCTGATGHVEVSQIEFDPKKISYERLLEVFWLTHDPTTLNRQGADVGTHYRSAIFFHTPEQKEVATRSKAALGKKLPKPVVTEIVPAADFYEAENYHQDYFRNNPNAPYCRAVIVPKLKKLK